MRYRYDIIPEPEPFSRAAVGNVPKSGVALADAVLSGYEWKGTSLTYAFPDSKKDYGYKSEKDHGFAPIGNKIQHAVERVLDRAFGNAANDGFSIEGLTNLDIREGGHRSADIRYAESSRANPTAYAYYPSGGEEGGDIWFGKDPIYDRPVAGGYAFMTVLHETGHALGLKHGHQAMSFDHIKTTLKGKYDSLEYSVMTYHSFPGMKGNGYSNDPSGYPQSFMMADIRALQHMYGADFTTNRGDTVYKWRPDSGDTLVNGAVAIHPGRNHIFATIWDGGGTDTYDLSAYRQDLRLDLRPGEYSVFRDHQLADLNQFAYPGRLARGNIYNALQFEDNPASLIENAIGGRGDDWIRGNAGANRLTGGAGHDIFIFRAGSGSDTITDFTDGDQINLVGRGSLSFADLQALAVDSGGNVVIEFLNGDVLTLENRLADSLSSGNFILGFG